MLWGWLAPRARWWAALKHPNTQTLGKAETHYNVSEEMAMEMFYRSKTAQAFADVDLGLYGQSALNIAGDVIKEREAV